ncbi:MAG: phosphoenolpyruvate--protein phosphotransferase [Deltaproteobacteria bacterium]|nr:phosphoenolpyruvate--protein phosphotransferase [Deltaproteobacteria bacterium]
MITESHKLVLLEDVSRIIVASHDLTETLDHITTLLAERMGVEVCSIYLYDGRRLVLRSSRGLAPGAVGSVAMDPNEGLTGLTFELAHPVNVEDAASHPRYKFFPGIGEESFHSYLGVPLIHRQKPIGVLAAQTATPRLFSADEVRMLVTAASQLSTVIAHGTLLESQGRDRAAPDETPTAGPPFVKGIGASPGVALGVVHLLDEEVGLDLQPEGSEDPPVVELAKFDRALAQSTADVEALRDEVTRSLSEEDGAIFHAHLMMLEDRSLQEKVRAHIHDGMTAASAVNSVARDYIEAFLRLEDPYLRERAADVKDVAQRIVRHLNQLRGEASGEDPELREPTIVLAQDLTPSRFVRLVQPNLVGVALARGGQNAHTAILCRSAGIPAIVGLGDDLPAPHTGERAILDGNAGLLYIAPTEKISKEYARLALDSSRIDSEILAHVAEPPVTRDGRRIRLFGNAALLSDIPKILEAGGEGVGLYRTEFPFLIRTSFPDEDEQVEIYRKILSALGDRVATLRTLDVGGDKTLPYFPIPREDNPHLGWRSIRVSLEMEETFRIQVRALLRASLLGSVRIVFPMISTVEELRAARRIVDEERVVLAGRGIRVPPVPVGAMVEVPSAALALDRLCPLADFFSVGTNDLVQYVLAVDRANRKVAHLYDPLHPTVLDLIGRIAETARAAGKPVSVCGEMAGVPLGAAALLAVGIEELSLSPGALPKTRRLIQLVDASRLLALGPALRRAEGAIEVRGALSRELSLQGLPPSLWAPN